MSRFLGTKRGDIHAGQEALMFGLRGGDVLTYTGTEDAALFGGRGSDTLTGNVGDDFLRGGVGNDILNGGAGDDALYGGEGADVIDGGAGANLLHGGTGDDTLIGQDANSLFVGGDGTDTVKFNTEASLSLDVGSPQFVGVEVLEGGNGDDVITGNGSENRLGGSGGDDTVFGGGGNDRVAGGAGDDELTGGAGFDSFVFNTAALGGAGVDTLVDFNPAFDQIDFEGNTPDRIVFGAPPQDAQGDSIAIYDQASGELFFVRGGPGSNDPVLIAQLAPGTTLTEDNF